MIFENCYLNDEQKIRLCEICGELNADWVKTSTGYGTGGATLDDLQLMGEHTPEHVQVKAAGGVRDLDTLLEVRALGVTRCGASRTARDPRRMPEKAEDRGRRVEGRRLSVERRGRARQLNLSRLVRRPSSVPHAEAKEDPEGGPGLAEMILEWPCRRLTKRSAFSAGRPPFCSSNHNSSSRKE